MKESLSTGAKAGTARKNPLALIGWAVEPLGLTCFREYQHQTGFLLQSLNQEIAADASGGLDQKLPDDLLKIEHRLWLVSMLSDHHGNRQRNLRFRNRSQMDVRQRLGRDLNMH